LSFPFLPFILSAACAPSARHRDDYRESSTVCAFLSVAPNMEPFSVDPPPLAHPRQEVFRHFRLFSYLPMTRASHPFMVYFRADVNFDRARFANCYSVHLSPNPFCHLVNVLALPEGASALSVFLLVPSRLLPL